MASPRFVAFPHLIREQQGGDEVRLRVPAHGTEVEGDKDLAAVLDLFHEGRSLADVQEEVDLDAEDLLPLIRRMLLVDVQELPFLETGFLHASGAPALGAPVEWAELFERARPGDRVVFGVPTDIVAGGTGGARHGPREIRHAVPRWLRGAGGVPAEVMHVDLGRHYTLDARQVFDVGDIHVDANEAYSMVGQRVSKLIRELSDAELVPIMLGGDHSVSWFSLEPLLSRHDKLGVLHFDAHHDLYPTDDGKLRHLNPFDFVCREPSLALLLQLGLRTSEAVPLDASPVFDERIRCVSARELQQRSAEAILGDLPRDIPYYLTFDVDCLDPAIAPETGTAVVGGVGYYAALSLIDYATQHLNVIGFDFVEVKDSDRRVNMAAHAVGEYLALCALAGVKSEPLRTYYYRR